MRGLRAVSSARTTINTTLLSTREYQEPSQRLMIFIKNQTTPRPDLYILKGTAQYQMDQIEKTIESVEEAISLAESKNADRVTQLQRMSSKAGKYGVK